MINVDRIYQRVLTLANKEQRGYITPQEFNIFANQVQMDIFEQYFYDLNQFMRMPGNDTYYADMVSYLEEKIQTHEHIAGARVIAGDAVVPGTGGALNPENWIGVGNTPFRIVPDWIYKITKVSVDNFVCEKHNSKNQQESMLHPLLNPATTRPTWTISAQTLFDPPPPNVPTTPADGELRRVFRVFDGVNQTGSINNNPFTNVPGLAGQAPGTVPRAVDPNNRNVGVFYIRRPRQVNWTYVVVGEKALYNGTAIDAQDFDLHESEEQELVFKILSLAGFTLKDPNLLQAAAQEDGKNIQQEKQ